MSRTIIKLTAAQSLGTAVAAIGGTAVWLAATALARPAELGVLGQILSIGTLAAGLISGGLGQFLLLMAGRLGRERLSRYFWICLSTGSLVSALAAMGVALAQGAGMHTALLTALLAAGIAVTNLQDAIYLSSGMPADIPVKSSALIGLRLALLLALLAIDGGAGWIGAVFVGSQLLIGCGWAVGRAPHALRRHNTDCRALSSTFGTGQALGFSYLYTSAVAAIANGVPVLVTGWTPAADAGRFFLAWTLAGLLGSIAVAAANAILAMPAEALQRPIRLICGLLAALVCGALALAGIAPLLLEWLNPAYAGLGPLLAPLAAGQVGVGMALAALAARRARALDGRLGLLLVLWPTLVTGSAAAGMVWGGASGAAAGFGVGALLAMAPLALLVRPGRLSGVATAGQPLEAA